MARSVKRGGAQVLGIPFSSDYQQSPQLTAPQGVLLE